MTRLDWTDPVAVTAWLASLQVAIDDADAVAADMLRPPRARELGPALHRAHYAEAREAIRQLLDHAAPASPAAPAPRASAPGDPTPR